MKRLLIVDDEEEITAMLKTFFESRNLYVETAGNGEEALKLWKNGNFDVMTLGITMRGMSGLDVLKEIRKTDKKIKIVMLTARLEKEIIEKAKMLGADEYVTKPFRLDDLEEIIRKYCVA